MNDYCLKIPHGKYCDALIKKGGFFKISINDEDHKYKDIIGSIIIGIIIVLLIYYYLKPDIHIIEVNDKKTKNKIEH